MKRIEKRAESLISGLEQMSREHKQQVIFATGYLEGFEHTTAVRIANWLETLARANTQPADYYRRAADEIRRGNWRSDSELPGDVNVQPEVKDGNG